MERLKWGQRVPPGMRHLIGTVAGVIEYGVAGSRGSFWAASVARQVGTAKDWPPFEGKARTIALRHVRDLASNGQPTCVLRNADKIQSQATSTPNEGDPSAYVSTDTN